MRIAHVCNFMIPNHGYQEHFLAMFQARAGHDVTVITSNLAYPDVPEYRALKTQFSTRAIPKGETEQDGYRLVRLPIPLEIGWRLWHVGLERELRRADPELVIAHGIPYFHTLRCALVKLARRHRFRLLADDHSLWCVYRGGAKREAFFGTFRHTAVHLLDRAVDRYVGVTEETADLMEKVFGIAPDRISVIPLGVDLGLFHRDEARGREIRAAAGAGPDDIVIIYAGKRMPDKGPHLLLEAASPLMKADPRIRLLFVGNRVSPYADEMGAFAVREGIAQRTRFLAAVPNHELYAYYSAADLGVWPKEASISFLEACACGVPGILEDMPVNRERTRYGNGFVYRDPDDLRDKIRQLVDDGPLRLRMGAAGLREIPAALSWESIAAQFTTV